MDSVTYAQQQDALRPVRMFVGALQGALIGSNDQSVVGVDAYSYNNPYQYQSVGPWGASVEGSGVPITATPGGGVYISPMVVLIGIGAAAAFLLKK
jgi:hypothetical protein